MEIAFVVFVIFCLCFLTKAFSKPDEYPELYWYEQMEMHKQAQDNAINLLKDNQALMSHLPFNSK